MREVYAYAPRGYLRRLRGRADRGLEKCCQRFPGAGRCNHQRMFLRAATCQVCDWTAVGCLKARETSRGSPVKTRPAGAMKGLVICH